MNNKKNQKGYVTSNKMKNTSVVLIELQKKHPKYIKKMKISKKIKFHDQGNKCQIGDFVEIEETRHISKDKSWKLTKIINPIDKKETIKGQNDTTPVKT